MVHGLSRSPLGDLALSDRQGDHRAEPAGDRPAGTIYCGLVVKRIKRSDVDVSALLCGPKLEPFYGSSG
jgi:hypothetical protein